MHHGESTTPTRVHLPQHPRPGPLAVPASRADGALGGGQDSQLPLATPFPTPFSTPGREGSLRPILGWCFPGGGGGTAGSQLPCLSQAQGSWGPRPSPRPVPRPAAPPEQGRTWHDFLSPLRRDWMETGRLLSGQSYSGPRMWDGGKKFSWTGCLCQRLPAPSVDKGRH